MIEISQPTAECPHPEHWSMHDAMTAEVEVVDFIAQLVRTIKPRLVVETGTHKGFTARAIGAALRENGFGKLITCEVDTKLFSEAKERIELAGLSAIVDVRNVSSLELVVDGKIDLLFCDSDVNIRLDEVNRFAPVMSPNALILIHDVSTGSGAAIRRSVDACGIQRIFLPTPRGLAICQWP